MRSGLESREDPEILDETLEATHSGAGQLQYELKCGLPGIG